MRKTDLIYFVILFILLGAVFYMVNMMKSEIAQCVRNPFIYGASNMKDVSCNCFQYKDPTCPVAFFFNDTIFDPIPTKCLNSGLNLYNPTLNRTFLYNFSE